MRIISKFRDYYDGVQGMDLEKDDVWVRKQSKTGFKNIRTNGFNYYNYSSYLFGIDVVYDKTLGGIKFSNGVIGFCGNIIPFLNIGGYICFTEEDAYNHKPDFIVSRYKRDEYTFNKHVKAAFLDQSYERFQHIFSDYDCPSFRIQCTSMNLNECELTINPTLNDSGFFKLKDSYTAYQDISMYVFGVLGNRNDKTVTISDEDMKKQKGFGHKYAFKKEPKLSAKR